MEVDDEEHEEYGAMGRRFVVASTINPIGGGGGAYSPVASEEGNVGDGAVSMDLASEQCQSATLSSSGMPGQEEQQQPRPRKPKLSFSIEALIGIK